MTLERERGLRNCAYPPHPGADERSEPAQRPHEADTALSQFRRWMRHAPAERVPVVAVPATWTAAEIMHAAGAAGYIPGIATVVAASIAFGIGEGRARRSEHKQLEGAELAATAGVPGAWLTAATIWGPLWGPFDLMTLIYLGIAGLGYWWLRRREAVRAARARRDQAAGEAARRAAEAAAWLAKKAEWHRLAPKVGLQGSDLLDAQENQNDSETWLIDTYGARRQLASQVSCRTVAQRLSGEKLSIAGWHPVPMNRIEVSPHPEMAYQLLITFRGSDLWKGGSDLGIIWHPSASGELDESAPYAELVPEPASILSPVTLGGNPETGEPLQLILYDEDGGRRVLVVGASNSGKSMLLDTIRERVTACTDAILLQVNLSKGVEDSWWEPLTAASALGSIHGDQADARALRILDFTSAVILDRPRSRTPGVRVHQPTPAEPAIVLMIDEVDKVANDEDRKHQLGEIASKVRSEGGVLILGSQRPQNQYIGGPQVRANLSDVVWGRMRASDRRQTSGGDTIELPDMGDYGSGNAGVFGVAAHPTYEGMPFARGRAFFWGKDSQGLIKIIRRRAATRRPYQLEPGLAALAPLWAEITGTATSADRAALAGDLASRGQQERYDIRRIRDGSTIPSGEGVQRKLDAAQAILDGDLPGELRARMQAGTPDAQRDAEKQAYLAERQAQQADPISTRPLPAAEQAGLWRLINQPGGISGREAARQLERSDQTGARSTWSYETVLKQLRLWEAEGKIERGGRGKSDNRWHALAPGQEPAGPRLYPVPDAPSPGDAETAVSDGACEPDQVYGPDTSTPQELVMTAAIWGLRDPDLASAAEGARQAGMPEPVVQQAMELLANDRDYIIREARRTLTEARAPIPPWLGGPPEPEYPAGLAARPAGDDPGENLNEDDRHDEDQDEGGQRVAP
jgi:hypothetical protein